jgi:hypothetical protein
LGGVYSVSRTQDQQEQSEDWPSDAQEQHAKVRGIKLVQGMWCLKRIVSPGHRHDTEDMLGRECPYVLHLDHPRMWRTSEGELFATADPYHVGLEDLEPLLAISRELGLDVTVDGRSIYWVRLFEGRDLALIPA